MYNNRVDFDANKYKKASPNYGLIHDYSINPIENKEKSKEIAIAKVQHHVSKTKTSNNEPYPDIKNMSKSNFFNMKNSNNRKKEMQRTSSCGSFTRNNNYKISNEQKLDKFIEEHQM